MRKQKGFTLIELLIVVAIIGIIAAIAIPNLLNAINRGRQKRSMSDMRTIGTATEAYAVDMSFYPTLGVAQLTSSDAYVQSLQPTYIKNVPTNDGWRQQFWVESSSRFYTILSSGRDKTLESSLSNTALNNRETGHMDCDIVYSNGSFISYPAGIQTD